MYNYYNQKHKVFTSYYHKDDQKYKNYIDNYFSDIIINKSVMDGEINSNNSTEYIKRLIREDYISDSSVIIVLVGKNTKTRKYVDWEIYAGLNASTNGNSGLVAILLPGMEKCTYNDIPGRLADNIKSGYCMYYTWDYAIKNFSKIIDEAFENRIKKRDKLNNSRLQMSNNTTGWN